MPWKVPLADISLGVEEEDAVLRVLRSRWLSMGEETRQFEEEFAAFIGAKHAFAVANATAALHMACLAAGIGPGDEVVVPALTFVATANAVRYTGGVPVFADIENEDWLTISPTSIEKCLTEKTRAILVMHYAGYACDMPAIQEIATKHKLVIIEDAAHAIGSQLKDRMLGTWGKMGCFSFFSNKNMTTGEGGMVVTDDDSLAEKLRLLRSHGMTSLSWDRHKGHAWTYDVVDLGHNYRIDEIRSSIGRAQLKKVVGFNQCREKLTRLYQDLLSEVVPQVRVPFRQERGVSCHHIMPILLPMETNRFDFMEGMKAEGVQTSIHYPPVHQFTEYRNRAECHLTDLSVTESVGKLEVTLPLFPAMTNTDVEIVVTAIQKLIAAPK